MSDQLDNHFSALPALPPIQPDDSISLPDNKLPLTRAQKLRDFLIGFGGWWLVNGLATGCYYLVMAIAGSQQNASNTQVLGLFMQAVNALSCLWMVINVGVLVWLAFKRPWIAIGIAAAHALLFVIGLCLGIFLLVFCFWVLGQYNA